MVLLCFSLLCRKRAKSDEIGRKSDKWQNSGVPDASRTTLKRVASTPVVTLWRDSHCSQFTPLNASRVPLMRVASEVCRQAQKGPNWGPRRLNHQISYLKGSSVRSEASTFPSHFSQNWEIRDLEKRAPLEEAWRGSKKGRSRDHHWITSTLQAQSWFVLSFSLLPFFTPCVSRSLSF